MRIAFLYLLLFLDAVFLNAQITFGTDTDTEGNTFRTITINKEVGLGVKYAHIWTAENLSIEVDSSWCYEDNPANCQRYGRLYTWEAAKEACRKLGEGWRLPTDVEWQRLMHQFTEGGLIYDDERGGDKAAYSALVEGGSSGFAARLGGYRGRDGEFIPLGRGGYYWSSTEFDAVNAWLFVFNGDDEQAGRNYYFKSYALSCRCLKDN